jgi:apolipoprotein N-acyltransferase
MMANRTLSDPGRRLVARYPVRAAVLCCVVAIAMASASCENENDRKARETAALQAKFDEQLKAENAATARALAERARADREASSERAVDIQAESEAAFAKYLRERPAMTASEESTATDLGVARIRARMTDPDAMQIRNAHLNAAKSAMCAEVNYREAGKYQGYRRAYVTPDVIWVEPAEDDVTHRVFELNLKRMGCDQPADTPP